ncbi:hypothetical protein [Noviherbaspirillum suwonense]|jgi:hypothetical protein|uniref:Transposase n=1 Tax=Noviherbaspirillum suwonense TaxID=1224511 RepID=A0ABY1QIU8_9BURK|nr:hypothetical protein [Noviherbaspirillum suwonense]SMP72070.1 hypothetical protein SAMN06295970_117128 [Noviherbaspirillum suwonense]
MDGLSKPSDKQERKWLKDEAPPGHPPPDPAEARRRLDWYLSEREYQLRQLRQI